ncbi:Glycoside hydrolase, family 76 [Cordyceps fumosorosea ARSEF 2679]|uniref:Glycoside hydrolase, family 76 n=1 Tax=Cordyceps fumosorosea (strain ARSEF 2679) TaxID=1081104 RepID=A0A167W002_CORFA|nr:Glycoside hydrolase, family 76 [Cordyceps fumosorosea ARSEF 2679]OAA63163.1 Glycoside hydrolase, family 76 [Cordyceps fumosorosea ARSEF 2679]
MFVAKIWYASSVLAALVNAATAARASPLEKRWRDKGHYANNTALAAYALQGFWYNQTTGLWDNAWWNSGNALTILADWARLRPLDAESLNISDVIHNTWSQAQNVNVFTTKTLMSDGMIKTEDCLNGQGLACDANAAAIQSRAFRDFLNDFYDDEGWWALGLIHAYDYTHRQEYLDSAVRIFNDMQGGGNTTCNGGIYWSKERKYVNAIANELYLSVAASLANRIPNDKAKYTGIAQGQWRWFGNSSMINSDNLINDGLDGQCKNNGQKTWTYNQGVVLGGLVELYKATGNRDYLNRANSLASASMKKLVNSDGLLVEGCEDNGDHCGADGAQFKGVYARNLRYLNEVSPSTDIKKFLTCNADSIWDKDRDGNNRLGVAWAGPLYSPIGNAHSSAMDALVGAVAVV